MEPIPPQQHRAQNASDLSTDFVGVSLFHAKLPLKDILAVHENANAMLQHQKHAAETVMVDLPVRKCFGHTILFALLDVRSFSSTSDHRQISFISEKTDDGRSLQKT